jgi:tRNA splicing endonuclease
MTVQGKQFTSYEDLHTDILKYIEGFTQGQPVLKNGMSSFDLTITNDTRENFEYSQRKIMSKLLMCGNYIAVNTRRGPGTTLLAHPETISKYFYGDKQLVNATNYTLIESNIISKDKFIILRADINGGHEDGLFVIKSLDEDQYFMKETPSLKNRIMWFHIK